MSAAKTELETALKLNPKLAEALYGRGTARQKNSADAARADLAAAKAIQANIAEEFAKYGVN